MPKSPVVNQKLVCVEAVIAKDGEYEAKIVDGSRGERNKFRRERWKQGSNAELL